MSFAHPAILLLLWLVPLPGLLVVWSRRRQKRRAERLVHPAIAAARGGSAPGTLFNTQLGLFLLGLALLVIAAARPRWGEREEIVFGSGRNVLILLDVSRSMLAGDVHPNRLERAKADLADLLAELEGDRAGIMTFRNGAALLCPFTTDLAFLSQTLSGITIDSAPRGETDIGGAISAALAAFKDRDGEHNAIILISDGEDLSGQALARAAEARERGIPIFCVGIGDARGTTIPTEEEKPMAWRGETVVTKLDNQTLLDISTTSGGAYIPLQTAATGRTTLGTLYDRHVRAIIARELQEMREARRIERFQLFLIPAILALLASAGLSCGRPTRRRKKMPAAIRALLVLVFWPATLLSEAPQEPASAPAAAKSPTGTAPETESAHTLARRAQRAAKKGHDGEAARLYESALTVPVLDSKLARTLHFNAALALLKAGNAGQAAGHFRALADDPEGGAEAAEGLGVALFRAAEALGVQTPEEGDPESGTPAEKKVKLLEAAAAAFQTAMRGLPEDDRRRRNLAAALASLPRLREAARTAAILAKYGEMKPEDLARELLDRQRQVYAASAAAIATETPDKIRLMEQTAGRQRAAADIWTPLHAKLAEEAARSITNETRLADFMFKLDTAKDQAESAADALANLDPAAMDAMRTSEETALQLLSMTAPPPLVLAESILAQSNALARALNPARPRQPIEDQNMSGSLFNLFAERYGPWLDQHQGSAPADGQADTAPTPPIPASDSGADQTAPITAAVRKTIDDLVGQTLGSHALVQMDILPNDVVLSDKARFNARQALDNMIKIMELLPKPPPQENQQEQQKKQNQQQQQQDQPEQQSQDGQQDENQQKPSESPEAEPNDDRQEKDEASGAPPQTEPGEEPQEAESAGEPQNPEEEEAERILAEILEQEKEREEERRRRLRSLPPRAGERDW